MKTRKRDPDVHPRLVHAELEAMESQLAELEEELTAYQQVNPRTWR